MHSEWHIGMYRERPSVLLKFKKVAWEFVNILQQWLVTREIIIFSCAVSSEMIRKFKGSRRAKHGVIRGVCSYEPAVQLERASC